MAYSIRFFKWCFTSLILSSIFSRLSSALSLSNFEILLISVVVIFSYLMLTYILTKTLIQNLFLLLNMIFYQHYHKVLLLLTNILLLFCTYHQNLCFGAAIFLHQYSIHEVTWQFFAFLTLHLIF